MTIRDLIYSCGNVNKKTTFTIITAIGNEVVSNAPVSYICNQTEVLSKEVDYFKVFEHTIIILV